MAIGIARISEGQIILPSELQGKLTGIDKLLVLERGDTIVLEKTVLPEQTNLLVMDRQVKSVDISQRNRRAIELLDTWQREVSEYDAIWWDDFESELRQSRVTFRSN